MIDLDRIANKLNTLDKQKLILVILICVVVAYVDLAFVITAQFKSIKVTGQKIAKLNKDINMFSKEFAAMQKTEAEQSKKPTSKAKTIIAEKDFSSLLETISNIANKANVRIMQIKPERDLKDKDNKTSVAPNMTAFLINLDLLCGYHSLGKFINGIENSDTFMAIEQLRISANSKDAIQQNVNLVIRTYAQK